MYKRQVLLKQHSCIDVALGALLALALDSAFTALERSQLPRVRRAKRLLSAPLALAGVVFSFPLLKQPLGQADILLGDFCPRKVRHKACLLYTSRCV